MANEKIQKRRGAYLPHWTREGGIYTVRFRLADSIPQSKLREWEGIHRDTIRTAREMRRELSLHERLELIRLHSLTVESFLRKGFGQCWLGQPAISEIVSGAIRFFDGDRYRLFAWCVMPNHVHVVVKPSDAHPLSDILHSWKRFTARESNKILARAGAFWQRESFDRLIRTDDHLRNQIAYVWENPEMAGIKDWKWRWKISDADLKEFVSKASNV